MPNKHTDCGAIRYDISKTLKNGVIHWGKDESFKKFESVADENALVY